MPQLKTSIIPTAAAARSSTEEISLALFELDLTPSKQKKGMAIHLQPWDAIKAHAAETGKTLKVMVLDIDETLLTYNEHKQTFSFKCSDSWKKRMRQERTNDLINNTLTVWGIGTFRHKIPGLFEQASDGKFYTRPEINWLFDEFQDYINLNLVMATGGEGPDGSPGCKVEHILKWYHEEGIPKQNITIFDDQLHSVIGRAKWEGYGAVHIPEDAKQAAQIIENKQPSVALTTLPLTPSSPQITDDTYNAHEKLIQVRF